MIPAPAGDNALPFGVVARFLVTGALALALAATALALRPELLLGAYAAPGLLAVVHGLTLGFATLILVGALHQLAPVLLVTRLYAPRLGDLSYALMTAGMLSIVLGFALGYRAGLLALGGGLELGGLLVFAYNFWRTRQQAAQQSAITSLLFAALGYLVLTVSLGLGMALARLEPALVVFARFTPLHLGLGLGGAFFLAVAAAGHRLLAMFVLAHGMTQTRLRTLGWLLHVALLALLLQGLVGGAFWRAALGLMAGAVLLYALDLWAILAGRMRKALEPALQSYLLASVFLFAALGLTAWGELPAAVTSVLAGFLPLAVTGMLVKIGGFLSWQHRYAAESGKAPVPLLRDMVSLGLVRLSVAGLFLGALGLVAVWLCPVAVLARVASFLWALGAWGALAQLLWTMFGRHPLRRPLGAGSRA